MVLCAEQSLSVPDNIRGNSGPKKPRLSLHIVNKQLENRISTSVPESFLFLTEFPKLNILSKNDIFIGFYKEELTFKSL